MPLSPVTAIEKDKKALLKIANQCNLGLACKLPIAKVFSKGTLKEGTAAML